MNALKSTTIAKLHILMHYLVKCQKENKAFNRCMVVGIGFECLAFEMLMVRVKALLGVS